MNGSMIETQRSDKEIADLARRLASVLDADEPGLATWHNARLRLGRELYDALGAVLPNTSADANKESK